MAYTRLKVHVWRFFGAVFHGSSSEADFEFDGYWEDIKINRNRNRTY